MDELVHHCLRELSFDGDLGSNVSRLRDFILGFYASQQDHPQLIDDAFCAFVWSIIVQQPSVRIGTLPRGLISQVYIAPQTSAKRKAAAKGEEVTDGVQPSLILVEDARHRHLEDLQCEYGDDLRLAVDPETSFTAITGSHIRPPKLSPMVYSALQLITRGREDGITTVELGRKTGYDQKTCFYLIKQLVELSLIIKARRGGVGNHTCIHRYFIERSPLWQQIREEVQSSEGTPGELVRPCDTTEEATDQDGSQIVFDPIDSRHLSSLSLIKNRIVKLLKASKNHIHRSNNLLMTIGFAHPTKTDRRFFQTRLRELIQQGIVERVLVPNRKAQDRTTKCIRLVTSDNQLPEGSVVVEQDIEEDEGDPSPAVSTPAGHTVKTNLTIYKQVSNMLEEAGPSGLTLNEICIALGDFDKRTIELLLTRASNSRPPVHLGDLGTIDLMETYGRERRHRYFTLAAYKCVMESEQLQSTTTSIGDVDLTRVGDFAALNPNHFYASASGLHSYQNSYKDTTTAQSKKRKRDEEIADGDDSEPLPKPKRGRPRKAPGPAGASTITPKKRGRPRKNAPVKDGNAPGGLPSERMTEVCTTGNGQTIKNATSHSEEAMVTSQQAGEVSSITSSHREQIRPSAGGPTLVDANQQLTSLTTGFSRFTHPVEEPTSPLQTKCNIRAGSSHQELAGRISDAQLRYPTTKTTSRGNNSPKRTGKNALGVAHHLAANSVGNSAMRLSTPELAKEGGSQSKSPTSATREEECAVVSSMTKEHSPITDHDVTTGEKHKEATPLLSTRPSKRSRTNGSWKLRSNINISSLRRENELLKVIENMGGIANMHSRGIFEEHTALLDAMSQTKEPASAPAGTRLDKRTAESTLKSLENRGRVRMLKTSLTTSSGASRPACLVYLPDTPQEQINAFLRQLSQSMPPTTTAGSVKVLEKPIEYGTGIPPGRKVEEAPNIAPVVPNPEKPVELSIEAPPVTPTVSTKRRGKAKEEREGSRRPRFHWTREFDELARDASAIIRARCRASRLDLSALAQVFPAVPRNSVRQRIMHLRDSPAEDLYMKRLEDQWYTVWLQHRSTPRLPDGDPDSPSNFNLIKHIEFLRTHVDKNALRVGFVERKVPSKLASSVEELHKFYEVTEDAVFAPAWDFMWGTTVEEAREKQFRSQALTKEPDDVYNGARDEKVQLAEAALKMVFGTPSDLYDPDIATRLLHSVGDQWVSMARSNLLYQGVMSKLVRDPKKPKPGRMLKISDSNLSSIGGPFPQDLFQDAVSLEEVVVDGVVDGMEWPLITSEGDIAALLQFVSEARVDFTMDLSQSQAVRPRIDWNSKRADDEDVETGIRLRFSHPCAIDSDGNRNQGHESPVTEPGSITLEQHGTTFDGMGAACALKAEIGFINCSACVNTAFTIFTSSLVHSDRDLARQIFDGVRGGRETGLSKAACMCLEAGQAQHILWLAHKMTLTSPPILFWAYFNTPVLVAGDYCSVWSVIASDEPLTLITPRRWLDLRGYRLDGAWRAAQQAVVGVIFLHPGISQAELRWRLRVVYDRQEIIDLLSSLLEDGILECRTDASVETIQNLPAWLRTLGDEEIVLWSIAKNHRWYQI